MKEQIKNWCRHNNNHECDHQLFYDIVINSLDEKIDEDTFDEALREGKPEIKEDEISKIYARYEDLRSLLSYYLSHNAR